MFTEVLVEKSSVVLPLAPTQRQLLCVLPLLGELVAGNDKVREEATGCFASFGML